MHVCSHVGRALHPDDRSVWRRPGKIITRNVSVFKCKRERGYAIRPEDIPILTKTYRLNSEQVVAEFVDFCEAFKTLSHSEVDTETVTVAEFTDDSSTADCELDENDEPANWSTLHDQKTRHSFTEPLSILYQLSGYEHLLRLYWTLVTLPVTSCSAERALSRLKIIKKNRLRSTMSDEWMSDLMVLAAEKDVSFLHFK
jgi:hypothetical protein